MKSTINLESKNIISTNIELISQLFPHCITAQGGKKVINFEKLKAEFSNELVDETKEKYELNWPGKRAAINEARIPTNKTLIPLEKKSIDFKGTNNVYIEGDNLEVLKILQESYLNKIKCIYIDPPYNTGKDFIYKDDFKQSSEEELFESGQTDEEGNKFIQNTETNGRYHSDWLSMMYPRLKLARNLLKENGVIFISIDDNEYANLKKMCDEIFGEINNIASLVFQLNPRGEQSNKNIAISHEYVLIYQKSQRTKLYGEKPTLEKIKEYKYEDSIGKYSLWGLRKRGAGSLRTESPNLYYPVYYIPGTNHISLENSQNAIEITPKLSDGQDGRWRWSREKLLSSLKFVEVKKVNDRYDIFTKNYLTDDLLVKYKSIFIDSKYNNEVSTRELKRMFEGKKGI
ncbi:MAG: site-specific DNA-methyltransferase [Bacilli bacterium]